MIRSLTGLKLRQLQYFLAVAETLSFTRAAERLGATQPTLSHQIAELEENLGSRLFDRAGKVVRLTQAGEVFRGYATRAIKQLESGFVALSELEGLVRGQLRLGVIQSFSRTLLPPVLGAFLDLYPGIRTTVTEMNAGEIETGLSTGQFDLGIAFTPAVNEETQVEVILQEELLLVVAGGHEFADEAVVAMRRLDGQRLILLDATYSTRRLIDACLATANARPDVVCTTNSMEIMLATVARSGLSTIIPERGFDNARSGNLKAIRLRDPTPLRTSAILWPRDRFRTAAARVFGGLIHDYFEKTPA